jgi:hypothetical protein
MRPIREKWNREQVRQTERSITKVRGLVEQLDKEFAIFTGAHRRGAQIAGLA